VDQIDPIKSERGQERKPVKYEIAHLKSKLLRQIGSYPAEDNIRSTFHCRDSPFLHLVLHQGKTEIRLFESCKWSKRLIRRKDSYQIAKFPSITICVVCMVVKGDFAFSPPQDLYQICLQ